MLPQQLDPLRVGEGLEEADENRSGGQFGDLVRCRACDPDDGLRARNDASVGELGSGARVLVVSESRRRSGTGRDANFEAGRRESGYGFGDERHAALARSRLHRHRDSHGGRELYAAGMRSGTGNVLERGPDLELRLRTPDHLVREGLRPVVTSEVRSADSVCDGLEAGLSDSPPRILKLATIGV